MLKFAGAFYHVMARGNRHNPSSTVRKRMCQDLHTDPQIHKEMGSDLQGVLPNSVRVSFTSIANTERSERSVSVGSENASRGND